MYTISGGGHADWSESGDARVLQNVRNLINTYRHEIAYDRTCGIDRSIFDRPQPEVEAIMPAAVMELIEAREPRVRVVSVDVRSGGHGVIEVQVVVEL